MKNIGLFIIGILISPFAISQTASPELVSSAGDSFKNSTYQLSWSIGECVTATHTAGTYIITQGLHQNSYVVTEVVNLATDINISVYPNPTSNFIIIRRDRPAYALITVTDLNGKILQQIKGTSNKEQLDFRTYVNGVYFISIKQENKLIKSFKILKN